VSIGALDVDRRSRRLDLEDNGISGVQDVELEPPNHPLALEVMPLSILATDGAALLPPMDFQDGPTHRRPDGCR